MAKQSHGGWRRNDAEQLVRYLLGEALLRLDLVVLLCCHTDATGRRPRQRLHLFDGLHRHALRKHLEQ